MKFPIYPKTYLGTLAISVMVLLFYMQSLPEKLSDTELQFIHHTTIKKGHWLELQKAEHARLVSLCKEVFAKDKKHGDQEKITYTYVPEPVIQQIKVSFGKRYKTDLLTDVLRCTVLTLNVVHLNFYLAEGDTEDSVFKMVSIRNSDKNGPVRIDSKIVGLEMLPSSMPREVPTASTNADD